MRKYANIKQMAEILGISESDFLYFLEGGYFEGNFTQVMKTEQYPHGYTFRDKHVKFIRNVKLPVAPSQFRVKKLEWKEVGGRPTLGFNNCRCETTPKKCEEMTTAECMAIDCEHLVDGECDKKMEPVQAFEGQENELIQEKIEGETLPPIEPDIIHLIDQVEKAEKSKRKYTRKAKQENG